MSASTGFHGARPGRAQAIITPDGVRLTVRIADISSRLAAALLDFAIIAASVLVVVVLAAFAFRSSSGLSIDLALLSMFLIRVFYFPFFEMVWSGRTPGKIALGLRVMDRNGHGLTGEAVLARNLVREVEFFLPIMLAISQPDITGNIWANLAAYGFILLIVSLPLLNKERMRGGDILAGTWVVYDEAPALLPDLAASSRDAEGYSFTDAQLRSYGLKELETLAAVLRESGEPGRELMAKVAATIQRKIGYKPAPGDDAEKFLRAFYAALRGALERRKAATGYAPEDKHVAPAGVSRRSFSKEQLDHYGAAQLRSLSALLRESGEAAKARRAEAAATIARKIGVEMRPDENPEAFLRAFHAALNAHLES